MTYTEALEEFLLDGKLKGNSKHTYIYYQRVLGYFQKDMDIERVEQITLSVCKQWLLSLMGHSTLDMVKKYLHLSNFGMCRTFGQYSPVDNLQPSQLHSSETA